MDTHLIAFQAARSAMRCGLDRGHEQLSGPAARLARQAARACGCVDRELLREIGKIADQHHYLRLLRSR